MLKKQTVWLLTMLSLVVVLSVYYIMSPESKNAVQMKSEKSSGEVATEKTPAPETKDKSGSGTEKEDGTKGTKDSKGTKEDKETSAKLRTKTDRSPQKQLMKTYLPHTAWSLKTREAKKGNS